MQQDRETLPQSRKLRLKRSKETHPLSRADSEGKPLRSLPWTDPMQK